MAESESGDIMTAVAVPSLCISMTSSAAGSVTEVNRVTVHSKCVETWRAGRFAL